MYRTADMAFAHEEGAGDQAKSLTMSSPHHASMSFTQAATCGCAFQTFFVTAGPAVRV